MKLCLFDITLFSTIILLTQFRKNYAILCLDGHQCSHSCSECEGIGCLRIVRQVTSHDNRGGSATESRIALTCLPSDTAAFMDMEPAGCRTDPVHKQRVCVCYDKDFCNGSTSTFDRLYVTTLVLFVFLFTTTFARFL